jgi:hypothetical protein
VSELSADERHLLYASIDGLAAEEALRLVRLIELAVCADKDDPTAKTDALVNLAKRAYDGDPESLVCAVEAMTRGR